MKLETFFEKFDQFADAPGAVAKMRELVLQLAVTGRLVPQDPNDEPAKFTVGQNEELNSESPFKIPEQWTWTHLSELAEINGGFAFKSTAYTEDGMRVVRISDFDEFGFKDHKVVRHPFSSDLQKFTLAEQNILMAMTDGTVGKSYFVRTLPEPMVVNQRVAAIKVSMKANPSYLDIAIRSEMTQDVIRKAKNSTNDNISMRDIKGFPIPLPPLAEQKRIVAKVDELMALCDQLEAQQQAREEQSSQLARASLARFATAPTPANLNYLFHPSYNISPSDLRKSILTLAVQGKLLPQNPNDEPATADFESLVKARAKSPIKQTKIDSEVTAEDPVIPVSWLGVRLGELVSIRTGFAFKSGDYTEQGTFILRVTNINPDGSFESSNAVYLPEKKLDDKMRSFLLEEHELLVVMVGGSLGKIGLVTAEILPALLNQNMWRLKPYSERLDYRFLRLVLHDLNENRLQITPSTHGHLAMGTYAAAKVPFPPLAEQHRIVAKVSQLMTLVDELETHLTTTRTTAQNLLSALVAELTPK